MAAKKVYVLTYFYSNGTRNREYFSVKAAAEKQLRKYYRNHKGGHGDITAESNTAKKNPATKSFPVGKFVKVDSVRLNKNGTVTVKTKARR